MSLCLHGFSNINININNIFKTCLAKHYIIYILHKDSIGHYIVRTFDSQSVKGLRQGLRLDLLGQKIETFQGKEDYEIRGD